MQPNLQRVITDNVAAPTPHRTAPHHHAEPHRAEPHRENQHRTGHHSSLLVTLREGQQLGAARVKHTPTQQDASHQRNNAGSDSEQ